MFRSDTTQAHVPRGPKLDQPGKRRLGKHFPGQGSPLTPGRFIDPLSETATPTQIPEYSTEATSEIKARATGLAPVAGTTVPGASGAAQVRP